MGIFDSFFNNRKKRKNLRKLAELERSIAEKRANLDRLRNDPEYLKMKEEYNLEDVPGIDPQAKEVDLDDFLKNTQNQIKKSRARAAKSKKTKK
tara:strand:+ start:4032 stop:4313 length:282 start_codon:yes stop_codon:yes gene_type:complete